MHGLLCFEIGVIEVPEKRGWPTNEAKSQIDLNDRSKLGGASVRWRANLALIRYLLKWPRFILGFQNNYEKTDQLSCQCHLPAIDEYMYIFGDEITLDNDQSQFRS